MVLDSNVRHHQLILTIFGLYCREPSQALPVSALIEMLGELGHDAPGVRTAVSRLKAKDVLQSLKVGGAAHYSLSPTVSALFAEGDTRIFATPHPKVSDGWVLAIFSVPESLRSKRHVLRNTLSSFGFGYLTSGVWIAPATAHASVRERLRELELDHYVEFFAGHSVDEPDRPGHLDRMRAKVATWWDLDSIDAEFASFQEQYGPLVESWRERLGSCSPSAALNREAFTDYVPLLTSWRRFPYIAPSLPREYLPEAWHGFAASETFHELHALLAPRSRAYAAALLAGRTLIAT
ncbi:PaaX family transcriptional regulator [Micrococcales bacterium 31B]|nr:PaaX family transcriptional regulator [Micrococcales bacterium 31B]